MTLVNYNRSNNIRSSYPNPSTGNISALCSGVTAVAMVGTGISKHPFFPSTIVVRCLGAHSRCLVRCSMSGQVRWAWCSRSKSLLGNEGCKVRNHCAQLNYFRCGIWNMCRSSHSSKVIGGSNGRSYFQLL